MRTSRVTTVSQNCRAGRTQPLLFNPVLRAGISIPFQTNDYTNFVARVPWWQQEGSVSLLNSSHCQPIPPFFRLSPSIKLLCVGSCPDFRSCGIPMTALPVFKSSPQPFLFWTTFNSFTSNHSSCDSVSIDLALHHLCLSSWHAFQHLRDILVLWQQKLDKVFKVCSDPYSMEQNYHFPLSQLYSSVATAQGCISCSSGLLVPGYFMVYQDAQVLLTSVSVFSNLSAAPSISHH